MNIFKVLASGKKSFQEEYMSSVLAWLLNPNMEHGLGHQMLKRFLQALDLKSINIRHGFRDISNTIECKLEFPVNTGHSSAVIDIVYFIDNYVIGIENKIFPGSITQDQLTREYEGLLNIFPNQNVYIVYLTPEKLHAENEFIKLNTANKSLITWRDDICGIIENILIDENKGAIEPISEYTRHTLKALCVFIKNDFLGYDYDEHVSISGNNPATEGKYRYSDLSMKNIGFVGVQHGISGLIKMKKDILLNQKFQYTTVDMSQKRNWLTLNNFLLIANWLLNDTELDYQWDVKLDAECIYKIVSRKNKYKIFVGISGGKETLLKLDKTEILSKNWEIMTTDEGKSKQWFSGDVFRDILNTKGFDIKDYE